MKTLSGILISIVFLLLFSFSHEAEAAYPDKPITLILNKSGDNESDVLFQLIEKYWGKYSDQEWETVEIPVTDSAAELKKQLSKRNDGHTLGVMMMPYFAISSYEDSKAATPEDFEYVCQISKIPYAIAVRATSPFKSFSDVVKKAKKKPNSLKIAMYDAFFASHLFFDTLTSKYPDVKIEPVYMTNSPMEVEIALLNAEVDLAFINHKELRKARKLLRVIGITSEKPSVVFPEIPTLKEQGIDISVEFSRVFVMPKGVSGEHVQILSEIFKKIFSDSKFQAEAMKHHKIASYMDGAENKSWIYTEYEKIIEYLGKHDNKKEMVADEN